MSAEQENRAPEPLLSARGVELLYRSRRAGSQAVWAVTGVDLELRAGEVLGLVGESGSGKTSLGKALLRIIEPSAGTLCFEGQDLRAVPPLQLRRLRARMQMIYQSAAACLNPGLTVEQHLRETVLLHRSGDADRWRELVAEVLSSVRLQGKERLRPPELSGGEKRRVGVARALLPGPALIVADEPTAGLDASVKADVLEVMLRARDDRMSYLFISHELDIVRYVSERVLVMYSGRVIEEMPTAGLDPRRRDFEHHPYSQRLLASGFDVRDNPRPAPDRTVLSSAGCRYRGSCDRVAPGDALWTRCTEERPELVSLGSGHRIACHHYEAPPERPAPANEEVPP